MAFSAVFQGVQFVHPMYLQAHMSHDDNREQNRILAVWDLRGKRVVLEVVVAHDPLHPLKTEEWHMGQLQTTVKHQM